MTMRFRYLRMRLMLVAVGVAGFAVLEGASYVAPVAGDLLRGLAMLWLFAFGLVRFGLDLDSRVEPKSRASLFNPKARD